MIHVLFAVMLVTACFGKPEPSADELTAAVDAERGLPLPCGLDDRLYVPTSPELEYIREAAAYFGKPDQIEELLDVLRVRRLVRAYLGPSAPVCAEVVAKADELLNPPTQEVP